MFLFDTKFYFEMCLLYCISNNFLFVRASLFDFSVFQNSTPEIISLYLVYIFTFMIHVNFLTKLILLYYIHYKFICVYAEVLFLPKVKLLC